MKNETLRDPVLIITHYYVLCFPVTTIRIMVHISEISLGLSVYAPQSNPIIVFGSFADILIRSHLLNFKSWELKKIRPNAIRIALLMVASVCT